MTLGQPSLTAACRCVPRVSRRWMPSRRGSVGRPSGGPPWPQESAFWSEPGNRSARGTDSWTAQGVDSQCLRLPAPGRFGQDAGGLALEGLVDGEIVNVSAMRDRAVEALEQVAAEGPPCRDACIASGTWSTPAVSAPKQPYSRSARPP